MIYLMMGGPATGKGTRSKFLSEAIDIPHISTGELLREKSKEESYLQTELAKGKLIDDRIITNILEERIIKPDCKKGFILDGYPRTLNQCYLLDELLKRLNRSITKVIELTAPEDLVYKRILERRKCEKCGRMYGVDFPPKQKDICDDCGSILEARTDDTRETLKKRIETYKENSKEILDYYKNKGLLKIVDSSAHPEEIVNDVKD